MGLEMHLNGFQETDDIPYFIYISITNDEFKRPFVFFPYRCYKNQRSIRHRNETILLVDSLCPGPRNHPIVFVLGGELRSPFLEYP